MISNDILIEPDLQIEDGDIKIGPSDDNNSLYIVYSQPGQIRKSPLLGVGIRDFQNAPDYSGRDIVKSIRKEHKRDGYTLTQLDLKTDPSGKQTLSLKSVKIRK